MQEISAKEIIKPSHPTPSNKRILKLSLLDQLSPHVFNHVVFFYPSNTHQHTFHTSFKTTELLKVSLSKTLTYYYPFVGRLSQEGHIVCNDQGVEFYVSHYKGQLCDVLKLPELQHMSKLCPIFGPEAVSGSCTSSFVVIQVTKFDCGGMAISASFSHKVADASSISTFMNDWASVSRNSDYEPSPQFNGATYFPIHDEITLSTKLISATENCSTKRFVFDVSKIDALRYNDEIGGLKELRPTKFEIVTALICKSILGAFTTLGLIEPRVLNIVVNLRTRIAPPLLGNHIGNFALHNLVGIPNGVTDLCGLMSVLKDGMSKFGKEFVADQPLGHCRSLKIYTTCKELEKLLCDKGTQMFLFSSWCRFPFYQVDFGYGKPLWASMLPNPTKNCIFLCDTRDRDGIEAWFSLDVPIMSIIEHNKELLDFASLNLSPLKADSGNSLNKANY